ncbi:MAG: hypothetical protein Greene07147_595 [Parcubacteria group bacterium Greene0714_7]|nr:MAG: hypothetical protein Greene07147_595 [Parcubacteria group bacterium Greene0714_7]
MPLVAFAAVQQDPSALLSGSGGGLVPQCEGAECKACDISELANNVINFAVAFSVIVATLMFAYAGILYVTAASKPDQVKKAHGVFINVFVGLCIVLTAWLLVNITFSVLTGKNITIWTHIDCISAPVSGVFPDAPGAPTPRPQVTGGARGGTGQLSPTASVGGVYSTDAAAVRALQQGGVCGGSVPCAGNYSLAGIRIQTVEQLIQLHNLCGTQFTVTSAAIDSGGNRGGAHGSGFKADLRLNPTLNACIANNPNTFIPREGGRWIPWGSQEAQVYDDRCGNVYARERPRPGRVGGGPHWDIEAVRGHLCIF